VVTRATNGGLLDHGKLTAAVAHFGPGVRVVDLTAGRLHLGDDPRGDPLKLADRRVLPDQIGQVRGGVGSRPECQTPWRE
jgi:hypothetical protein